MYLVKPSCGDNKLKQSIEIQSFAAKNGLCLQGRAAMAKSGK